MRFTPQISRVVLTTSVILLAGCDSDNDPASPDGDARLSIHLTDAPGDVERAWVEIVEVTFRANGEAVRFIPEMTELIELTELLDLTHLLVEEQEIDPGTLTELRLVVGDAVLESKSGDVYVLGDPELPDGLVATGELQCPSCQQSGIKIKVSNDEIGLDGGESVLLLDFDVAQTFGHRAGNSGRWVMHPVVHATLVVGDAVDDIDSVLDDLQGVVVLASTEVEIPQCPVGIDRSVEDFLPTATAQTLVDGDGLPIVRAGAVDPAGDFSMGGMEADMYSLGYVAEFDYGTDVLAFDASVSPSAVTVAGDLVDGIVYTINGATCTPIL